ncbi:hypothetical protein HKD37_01G001506 [Glycine soja]
MSRDLQIINTSNNVKLPVLALSLNFRPITLTPPPPSPMTTGGHHKPPLLACGPPHGEDFFNQSGIFRIHLKDLGENRTPNPFFRVFFELTLTSMPFS